MEKEELKKLKEWCEAAAAAVNTLSAVKKMAPESIVLISEFPTDKEVHVFSDIEKISEASGKKLDKICLESKFTTVLLSKCVDGAYKFETQANNSTAKSPMGAFEQLEIDNDIVEVMKALEEF